MHVLLIYFSVIMILNIVDSLEMNDIQDLSEWCSNGRNFHYHLTIGGGFSDESVAMIATANSLNCSLKYSVKPIHNVMLVLEFPDLKPHERVCITEKKSSVTVSEYNEKQKCQYFGSNPPFLKMSRGHITVNFRNGSEVAGTIKVTATSMRDSKNLKCFSPKETECVFKDQIYCMAFETSCDGNINCGIRNSFDEDEAKCKGHSLSVLMVIHSIAMLASIFFLFVSFWLILIPKRKESFVYKFDQAMSLFDSESGIVCMEIDIQVLFPHTSEVHLEYSSNSLTEERRVSGKQ